MKPSYWEAKYDALLEVVEDECDLDADYLNAKSEELAQEIRTRDF